MTAKPLQRIDLPEHQRLLLDTIEDIAGAVFDHSHDNLKEIGDAMGWNFTKLRHEMRELTLKGFLEREFHTHDGKPRRWVIVNRHLTYRSVPQAEAAP